MQLRMRQTTGAFLAILGAAACATEPAVRWGDVAPLEGTLAERSSLFMRGDSIGLTEPAIAFVPPEPACAASVRVASDGHGAHYAVWWAPKPDSSAVLLVARRTEADSAGWAAPVVADARDASRLGCGRPAPAIAADGAKGYVHLAYFLDSPTDGRGVYGGHSLDRGAYFHGQIGRAHV